MLICGKGLPGHKPHALAEKAQGQYMYGVWGPPRSPVRKLFPSARTAGGAIFGERLQRTAVWRRLGQAGKQTGKEHERLPVVNASKTNRGRALKDGPEGADTFAACDYASTVSAPSCIAGARLRGAAAYADSRGRITASDNRYKAGGCEAHPPPAWGSAP